MPLIRSPRQTAADLAAWERLERYDAALAQSAALTALEERALAVLRAFAAEGPCYAGTSWGKDSTVIAHLVARLAAEGVRIPLVWIRVKPVENPDCPAVRDAFLAAHEVEYREVEVWCSRDDLGWHATGTLERGFAVAAEIAGAARHVSGVRGEESTTRRLRTRRWGESTHSSCAPLARWRGEDVFAYLYRHGLPVHPAYALTYGGALDRIRVRVSSLGGERGGGRGRREWEARYYWPEVEALAR